MSAELPDPTPIRDGWHAMLCRRCDRPFTSNVIRDLCGACGREHDRHQLPDVGEVSGT